MIKLLLIAALAVGIVFWLRRLMTPRPTLDEAEARAILGIGASAGADEIRNAHRKLVSAVHPDRGGSAELARRINMARDVLLKRTAD
ncbi:MULTISPECIES: DnaJ domain-containing protein [unclassified Sphingomonas]|uniref:DnaJ domain-containing protein n=1 Tax=unclassified Sphingomonas TaxID=196159 RepID=UPI000BDCD52A|nr:MAG: molecular chaperone DnaJ [Sphingomonas sp. 12-62-6]OYX39405.1 MAG: molecular chaperone DnaJ [Sphingomonas sp. 32-62-10]